MNTQPILARAMSDGVAVEDIAADDTSIDSTSVVAPAVPDPMIASQFQPELPEGARSIVKQVQPGVRRGLRLGLSR